MDDNIAGFPFFPVQFDEKGQLQGAAPTLPTDATDVYVISHGWNNDAEEAWGLYKELFSNFKTVAPAPLTAQRKIAIVGVFWPSKKFDELLAVEGSSAAAGGAAAGAGPRVVANPEGEAELAAKLQDLKTFFTAPEQVAALDQALALVPKLERDDNAREAFVNLTRGLVDAGRAEKEDASKNFFQAEPIELMERLRIQEEDLELVKPEATGGAAGLQANQAAIEEATGGAAGILSKLKGFINSAVNVLNYTTYYEMKNRAGIVGAQGVGPMIDRFTVRNIHLIGHSFGGRVVAAAAAESKTDRIRSMSLLQAAFSHNGFSQSMKGFFRKVVDLQRVKGPILVTHTKNDKAVGTAYPIASRLAGQVAAALGDENDKFGGLGRNGAQKMNTGEVIKGELLAVHGAYSFATGKFLNALADKFIADHGSVRGPEVAYAIAVASLRDA